MLIPPDMLPIVIWVLNSNPAFPLLNKILIKQRDISFIPLAHIIWASIYIMPGISYFLYFNNHKWLFWEIPIIKTGVVLCTYISYRVVRKSYIRGDEIFNRVLAAYNSTEPNYWVSSFLFFIFYICITFFIISILSSLI